MDIVYSPAQTLHHALELDGGQLVLSWESPIGAVRVAERLATSHVMIEPDPFDRELAAQIHDGGYLDFRASGWRHSTGRSIWFALPTVLVLEGGYATDELADNVAGVIQGFESFA